MTKKSFSEFNLSELAIKRLLALIEIANWHGGSKVDEALEYFDDLVKNYGLEGISDIELDPLDRSYYGPTTLVYSNTGDMYTRTLMYDTTTERFIIGCVGDWLEKAEQKATREKIKRML